MSKSNAFETALLKLIFQNTDITNLGDANGVLGSDTAGNLYVSLHTGDPGESGNQETNEADYTGYERVAVVRSASGWTVNGNAVNPAANIDFPQCTGGTNTITHFGVGTAASGTGMLLYKGTVTPNINVSEGVTPRLTTDTNITED
jgi:hypothetical protein